MGLTYIIEAPAYNKNIGGFCALHYLADRLIHFGATEVYLTNSALNPRWQAKTIDLEHPFFLGNTWADRLYQLMSTLKPYVVFNTFKRKLTRLQKRLFPTLLWRHFDRNTTVVICGEAFVGVPFGAKHVVRWIMNTPGVCGGDGIFGPNDHIFQYHPWYPVDPKYQVQGLLTAIDLEYQLNTYQNKHRSDRQGGAYLIRKGHSKKHNQHPADFVHADPILEKMSDQEAADFFNRIETFISYDEMTWISIQAALCGCKSIIIPGEGDRSAENLKRVNRINGLAYGLDDQDWADKTHHQLRPHFERLNKEYQATIQDFYAYCEWEIGSLKQAVKSSTIIPAHV
jgi:hypothetical protein